MSALGQKRTCAVQQAMSALPPIATAKADFRTRVMSALPPKADMCGATSHVCFGPIADIKGETLGRTATPSGACSFHRYVWRRSLNASSDKSRRHGAGCLDTRNNIA